jgi:3-isopropylmalate dehydrogenase
MGEYHIAVILGEGIGPEIVEEGVKVIQRVAEVYGHRFRFIKKGNIGRTAFEKTGNTFPEETREVVDQVFKIGGAVYSGPGSMDYVYRIRKSYQLYYKLAPLRPLKALKGVSSLREEIIEGVDILIVRENTGDIYFGEKGRYIDDKGIERAFQTMSYSRPEIEGIAEIAFKAARKRRKKVTSVDKIGAITEIGNLWRETVEKVSKGYPEVELEHMLVDHLCFQMMKEPKRFDVILAPNLFGDILADLGGALIGSRGLLFSGNFSQNGFGVYQTGHGCAFDIAGKNIANPIGQIFAGEMMLRYSFQLEPEARAIEEAVEKVLGQGYRTFDIMGKGMTLVNTTEMGRLVANEIKVLGEPHEKR